MSPEQDFTLKLADSFWGVHKLSVGGRKVGSFREFVRWAYRGESPGAEIYICKRSLGVYRYAEAPDGRRMVFSEKKRSRDSVKVQWESEGLPPEPICEIRSEDQVISVSSGESQVVELNRKCPGFISDESGRIRFAVSHAGMGDGMFSAQIPRDVAIAMYLYAYPLFSSP